MVNNCKTNDGDVTKYLQTGIIESYVLGMADPAETSELELMASIYEEVRIAINQFCNQLEAYVSANAVTPDPAVKSTLMRTINNIK